MAPIHTVMGREKTARFNHASFPALMRSSAPTVGTRAHQPGKAVPLLSPSAAPTISMQPRIDAKWRNAELCPLESLEEAEPSLAERQANAPPMSNSHKRVTGE